MSIELPAGHDGAELGVTLAALAAPRVVIQLSVEPLVRQLDDGAAAADQQLPELFEIVAPGSRQAIPITATGTSVRPTGICMFKYL